MSGVDDLVQWLRAQLDADERIARAATWCEEAASWHAEPSPFDARGERLRWFVEDAMDDGVVTHVDPQASDDEGVARHIAAHDPARVLREVEAKRRIVEQHRPVGYGGVCLSLCHTRAPGQPQTWPCLTLRLLALPYADRDGYQEAWRL